MRSLLTLTLAGAALLSATPAALANTAVSRESGAFGSGLTGDYIWVTDPASATDKRMDVQVTRVGNEIVVTDDFGAVNAHAGCYEQGAEVHCSAFGLTGLKIEGGNANDVLASDVNLPTVVFGDDGNDVLSSGPNDDQLHGDGGDDAVNGNAGTDSFYHEPGKDTFDGGDDRDGVNYGAASGGVQIHLEDTSTNDGLPGQFDRLLRIESASGSTHDDFMVGNDFANTLRGRAGNDIIVGNGANDLIDGGADDDDLRGNGGTDTLTYADRAAGVEVSLNDAGGDGEDGEDDNAHIDIEIVEGTPFADKLSGSATFAAANTLNGNGGSDVLDGRAGADIANGGDGADTLIGDVGADRLRGDGGLDTADYSTRSGEFTEDVEISPNSLTVNDDGGASDGPAGARDDVFGVEIVKTGDGNDTLKGTDFNDTFITGPGNDVITGGLGADSIDAGVGDDTLNIADGINDAPVKCGENPGDGDVANTDKFPVDFSNPLGQLQLQDCETVNQPEN